MRHMREHVVARSNSMTGGSVLAVGVYGREGARQSFASNVDLRGHSLMGVRSIVFTDGTVIPAGAPAPDPGPVPTPDPAPVLDAITCVSLEASSYIATPVVEASNHIATPVVEASSYIATPVVEASSYVATPMLVGTNGSVACSNCVLTDVHTTDAGPGSAQAANVATVHLICASLLPTATPAQQTFLVPESSTAPVAKKMDVMLVVVDLGYRVIHDSSPLTVMIDLGLYLPPNGMTTRTATCALALGVAQSTPVFASCLLYGPMNASSGGGTNGKGTVSFKITTNTHWEGTLYAQWTLTSW